ncbi:MAG: SpoIIE family protein phosphatase [Lachnospiraceae bacterium]|nr:SpoIIE family protein phosphatase [Lachnospiraceae bacterium]
MIGKLRYSIVFRILSGIVVLLVLLSVLIGTIGYQGFTSALLDQYADGAFRTAESAAELVNADHIPRFIESGGKSSEYQAAYFSMDRLCNSQGVTFIYVIQPDLTDYGHITFIFSTINHDSHYSLYDFGFVRATTNDDYRVKYRRLYEGGSERELVIRDQGYIQTDPHITAMVPLKGADGRTKAILCVQRQMDVLDAARRLYIRNLFLSLGAVVLMTILVYGAYIYRSLLFPIQTITGEAERFADESIPSGNKLTDMIRSRDEIGTLAGSVDRMEEQICSYMENLTRITAEKERIAAELDVARKIQAGMLPQLFPPFPDKTCIDLYATMHPAREVGGDFYDFFLVDDDHLALVIADVSGKGIPGALFMMISDILIRSEVKPGITPATALTRVNERIYKNNRAEMFVTVWLGILELSTGKLQASNAGHEYPVIKRAGGSYELFKDVHGLVLGALDDMVYKDYELKLEKGDSIFVYTDGVTEATDADNRLFGTGRLLDSLNRDKDVTVKGVLDEVLAGIRDFVKNAPQFDDITMMCLYYKGTDENENG